MIIFALSGSCLAQTAEDSSKVVDDVVVKETYKAELKEEKIPVSLQMDLSDLVKIPEKMSWSTIPAGGGEAQMQGEKNPFPFRMTTSDQANIHPEPVKVFQVHFKDLSTWQLDIFRSDGSLFRTINGEGNPPESIAWNGRGNDSTPMVAGHVYSYSFTAVDKAGNKRTFPGQSFSVAAAYFNDSTGVWIRIANQQLFAVDGSGMLPAANSYIEEIASLIHAYSQIDTMAVNCTNSNSDQFVSLLGKYLYKSRDCFQPLANGEGNKDCLTLFIRKQQNAASAAHYSEADRRGGQE